MENWGRQRPIPEEDVPCNNFAHVMIVVVVIISFGLIVYFRWKE